MSLICLPGLFQGAEHTQIFHFRLLGGLCSDPEPWIQATLIHDPEVEQLLKILQRPEDLYKNCLISGETLYNPVKSSSCGN